jgi:uncharacterized protein YndB with AHSA1/START domain
MVKARPREIQHQYLIRASPERVGRAITDPAWLTRWLADAASLTPRKGGRYSLGWTGGPTHTGTLADFVRGSRIAFNWSWPGVALRGTRFQLSVRPSGRGTLLELEHTGFPRQARWVDLFAGAEWGWEYFAMNLKSVLETGRDLRRSLDG